MNKIFEVTRRDSAARMGKLVLEREISTPAIIRPDGPFFNAGSMWQKREYSAGVEGNKIIILPHKSLPLHTREEIVKELKRSEGSAMTVQHPGQYAIGRVLHPLYPDILESDMYVLGAAKQFRGQPAEFVNSIIRIKENTRSDSLLYAPALATPENLSMLVYMGIDIVDDILPVIKGYRDMFLTRSGEYHPDRLNEFPCTCSVCSTYTPQEVIKLPKKERAEVLSHHNVLKLDEEMRTVRERIRSGNLREYIESQCRVRPWITASLRLVDSEHTFLEKRTPVFRSGTLYASTSESLNRVEIKRFAQRVMERYDPPDLDTLVLFPCSAKKPYSTSPSHQKFIKALGKNRNSVHEVIITSPVGIVPRELELMYPAAHYDTPVTGYWDLEERAWVTGCLLSYLRKNKYENIIAHVKGAYRDICESVEKELGLDFVYTSVESVTARASLDKLKKAVSELAGFKRREAKEAKIDIFRATANYQFGTGAGDRLTEEAFVRAPYPKFQLFAEKQLATLIPRTGTVALTLEGGVRLNDHPYYHVRIGDFIPHSTVLAPGVLDADRQIRPGDEVIVEGENVFGVGRAQMSGWEMKESEKGVAVELRHSLKKTDITI